MCKNYILIIGLLLGMIISTGCDNSNAEADNQTVVNVQVQQVAEYQINDSITYSGTIDASESVPSSFTVAGRVAKVYVDEGDFVIKGQILADLDKEIYQNTVEMSQAALNQARDAYKRLKPMNENGTLPEIKFIEVETALQQATAAEAIAQKNLDECTLYASQNGYVGSRSIEPGMSVLPGVAAITVVNIKKVYAKITVSENEIAQIQKGQACNITVAALDNATYQGVVEQVGVVANPLTHSYKVKVAIDNKGKNLKPGMICDTAIQFPEMDSNVIVPNHAVQVDENGRTFVYTVDNRQNIATRKYIDAGQLTRNGIKVNSGVNAGDFVVIAGQQKLADHSRVNIVK